MNRSVAVAGLAVILLGGGIFAFYEPARGLFDSALVRACEGALKEGLRAPSTYRRVRVDHRVEAISLDDYERAGGSLMPLQREFNERAYRHRAFIEFDAANAYGTPVRGRSDCTYDSLSDAAPSPHASTVRIDGKTTTDRLLEAIERQR